MPKTAIASLFSQLKYFVPDKASDGEWNGKFLVNQKFQTEPHGFASPEVPGRDDFLHKIGEAGIEMRELTFEHEVLKQRVQMYFNGLKTVDEQVNSVVASQPETDLLIKFDSLMSRYRVMCDFINILANNTPNEKLRPAVERFMRFKGKQILDEYAQKTTTIPLQSNGGNTGTNCPWCNGESRDGIHNSCEKCNSTGFILTTEPNGQNPVVPPLPQAG